MSSLFRLSRVVNSLNPAVSKSILTRAPGSSRTSTSSQQAVQLQQPLHNYIRHQSHHCDKSVARVQCPAPDFKGVAVIDGNFKELSLKDFAGRYLVLFFYPLDFTFVCPTEVIAFNDRIDEFKQLNTDVVAVSVDSHFSHLAWINMPRNKGGLGRETTLPILSDLKKQIAENYGCLSKNEDVALRALYIIDTKSIVRQITINDLPVGRSVDEILRLIKAFQFTDKHGEVCPANWQPNSKTINTKKADEYFSSQFPK